MIRTTAIVTSVLFAISSHAEPFDISDPSGLPFDLAAPQPSDHLLIKELGLPGEINGQSRAVELLGNEFSRAAAQGLVDAQETPSQSIPVEASGAMSDRSNLSVITGIDRDISISPHVPPTDAGVICLSDRDVDLTQWGDASDHMLLGKLRSEAIAENGDITPSGALKLARYYLVLGFGAEAIDLAQYTKDAKDRAIIEAIADIVDFGETDSAAMEGQIFCKGFVALWAALAQPIAEDQIPNSTNDIIRAFASLPYHLRAHLGPMLAGRFRVAGLNEQARSVLNAVLRGGTKSAEAALANAKLGLTGANPDLAREELAALSNGTDLNAAKALLELLEDADKDGQKPNVKWVEDVPSLVRATQGTEISLRLNIAGLKGKINLGQLDDVRLAIHKDGPGLTGSVRTEIAKRALIAATRIASDEVFIRSIIGFQKHLDINDLGRENRYALAERLSQIGLYNRAVAYLPQNPSTNDERSIASSVLSGVGQTLAAIDALEGQQDDFLPELGLLHAEKGDPQQALNLLSQGGEFDEATLLAIQTGDWDWVMRNGNDTAAKATQTLRTPLTTDSTQPINGALLTQSETRRLQAETLLNTLELSGSTETFTN